MTILNIVKFHRLCDINHDDNKDDDYDDDVNVDNFDQLHDENDEK